MRNLTDYLTEAIQVPGLSKKGLKTYLQFITELLDELNKIKLVDHKTEFESKLKFTPGEFGIGYPYHDRLELNELNRNSIKLKTTKFNGCVTRINTSFNYNRETNIDSHVFITCVNNLFNMNIKESLMDSDKDIINSRTSKIYDYVKNIHDVLTDTFKTNNILTSEYSYQMEVTNSDMGKNKYPTIYVDNLGIQLRGISINNDSINISIIAFESKNDEEIKQEKELRDKHKAALDAIRDLTCKGGAGYVKNKEYNNVVRICNYFKKHRPLFIDRVIGGKYFKCSGWYDDNENDAKKTVDKIKKNLHIDCIVKEMSNSTIYTSSKAYFILIPVATDNETLRFEYK